MRSVVFGLVVSGFFLLGYSPVLRAGNVLTMAVADDSLSEFVQLVHAAGFAQTLSSQGPYTVFVPNNKALDLLGENFVNELLKPGNLQTLRIFVRAHISRGWVDLDRLKARGHARTMDGGDIQLEDADIVQGDMAARNGLIHVIDHPLAGPRRLQ